MDQLKVVLKYLKKYHFWLLALVAMIAGLVTYAMASSSMSATYSAKKAVIDGQFSNLQKQQSEEKPPNESWATELGKLTEQQRDEVEAAWQKVYDEQKGVLRWPRQLGDEFVNYAEAMSPTDEFKPKMREMYQEEIKKEFPKLLRIVNAKAAAGSNQPQRGPAGQPPGTPMGQQPGQPGNQPARNEEPSDDREVVWDSSCQQRVRSQLDFQTEPTDLEIRCTQEDLWVYSALLNVIRQVNQDSPIARINRIVDLSVGKNAAYKLDSVTRPGRLTTGGASEDQAAAAAGDEGATADPNAEGRYVNLAGQKVTAADAVRGPFRCMPVYMSIMMDQREVNRLLVACANSPLPIEVRHLRLRQMGRAPATQVQQNQAAAPGGGPVATAEPESYTAPVELCGLIYIYNKPNKAEVGEGTTTAATETRTRPRRLPKSNKTK